MNPLAAKVPGEFTDEDKWFRFFYKKNLVVLVIGLFFAWFLWKAMSWLDLGVVGIAVGLAVAAIMTGLTMLPVPDLGNMRGAGQTLDLLLIKKWIRKKNHMIYVRGYGKDRHDADA